MNALEKIAFAVPETATAGSRTFALVRLIRDESGQDLIEYALIAAFLGLGALSSIHVLARTVANSFNAVGINLAGAI